MNNKVNNIIWKISWTEIDRLYRKKINDRITEIDMLETHRDKNYNGNINNECLSYSVFLYFNFIIYNPILICLHIIFNNILYLIYYTTFYPSLKFILKLIPSLFFHWTIKYHSYFNFIIIFYFFIKSFFYVIPKSNHRSRVNHHSIQY
jgi:hypothetical protein